MNMQVAINETETQTSYGEIFSLDQDTFFLQGVIDEIHRVTPMIRFKQSFAEAARTLRKGDAIDDTTRHHIQQAFRHTISYVNRMLYHTTRFDERQKKVIGNWLHEEFVAFCMLGTWPSRSLEKPQNIAGDHHTINQIYQNGDAERRTLGDLVNYCFFEEPACKAVKNRKLYIQNIITQTISKNSDRQIRVASIASGPAKELFAVYDTLGKDNAKLLKAVGIDIDKRACASVDDGIAKRRLNNYFSTEARNVLRLGSLPKHLQEQDIVYTMGLIDYFSDKLVIKILNSIYAMLKAGGTAVVGNFHTACDSRIFLDYLLDWELIYRTEDDMKRLFAQSDFAGCEVNVDFEAEGVNMLARCTKQ